MTIFKPGQLVQWGNEKNRLIGLVKSTRRTRRNGAEVYALVQWVGAPDQQEEYIPLKDIKHL